MCYLISAQRVFISIDFFLQPQKRSFFICHRELGKPVSMFSSPVKLMLVYVIFCYTGHWLSKNVNFTIVLNTGELFFSSIKREQNLNEISKSSIWITNYLILRLLVIWYTWIEIFLSYLSYLSYLYLSLIYARSRPEWPIINEGNSKLE